MDAVFDALGSATRRRILDIVKAEPGCTVGEVAAHFDTTRIAVMRHLRVLEEADLLISRRVGRKRRLYHNAAPIQLIHDRWTTEYSAFWVSRMADVKYRVESRAAGHAPAGAVPEERSDDGGDAQVRVAGRHRGADRGRVA